MIIYTVNPGDSLYSIARQFGVTIAELERFNGLPDSDRLSVGQDVLIPVSGSVYEVKSGDSLYTIALENDISLNELLAANPDILPPYTIYPGELVNIPENPESKRTISVNGYAYPSIPRDVLEQTLPYLTFLSIFSHSVRTDGTFMPINDEALISAAKGQRVAPVMVITNTEPGGGFSSDIAHVILNDDTVRTTLIDNVIKTALSKGYTGVDVDFEYIYPSDREKYNEFLGILSQRLDENGLNLSTAIAPKISPTQMGTLYEAHDYAFHGSVADYVVIMTYEWGYLYGPPMAIAPYNEVKRVISYAVSEIPSEKILMGMPNYAYDWALPYTQGRPASILSINEAIRRAADVGAEIRYNETSEAPFYEYIKNGVNHIVWFENARSTAARLQLVNDFNLGGVSYWTINQFYAQNWRVLENKFNIRKIL